MLDGDMESSVDERHEHGTITYSTEQSDASHVLSVDDVFIDDRVSYVEEPLQILDRISQILRNKVIPLVKVL